MKKQSVPKKLKDILNILKQPDGYSDKEFHELVRAFSKNIFRSKLVLATGIKDYLISDECNIDDFCLLFDAMFEATLWTTYSTGLLEPNALLILSSKFSLFEPDSIEYEKILKTKCLQLLINEQSFSSKSIIVAQKLSIDYKTINEVKISNSLKLAELFNSNNQHNQLQKSSTLSEIMLSPLSLEQYGNIFKSTNRNLLVQPNKEHELKQNFLDRLIDLFGVEQMLAEFSEVATFAMEIGKAVVKSNDSRFIQFLSKEDAQFINNSVIAKLITGQENIWELLNKQVSLKHRGCVENNRAMYHQLFELDNDKFIQSLKIDIKELDLKTQELFLIQFFEGAFLHEGANRFKENTLNKLLKPKAFEIMNDLSVKHPIIKHVLETKLSKEEFWLKEVLEDKDYVYLINNFGVNPNLFNNYNIASTMHEVANLVNLNYFDKKEYELFKEAILKQSDLKQLFAIVKYVLPDKMSADYDNFSSIAQTHKELIQDISKVFNQSKDNQRLEFLSDFNESLRSTNSNYTGDNMIKLSFIADKKFIQEAMHNFIDSYEQGLIPNKGINRIESQDLATDLYLIANYQNQPKNINELKSKLLNILLMGKDEARPIHSDKERISNNLLMLANTNSNFLEKKEFESFLQINSSHSLSKQSVYRTIDKEHIFGMVKIRAPENQEQSMQTLMENEELSR